MSRDKSKFNAEELKDLGFTYEEDGGFFYFIRPLDKDDPETDYLVTDDIAWDENVGTRSVSLMKMKPKMSLTKSEIEWFINKFDTNG